MQGVGDISSAPEVVANLATGGLGQALGGYAGIAGSILPGPQGQGAEWSEKVANALTYQPRNQAAKKALGLLGEGMETVNTKLGDVGESVGGNAGRTIGESALPAMLAAAPLPKVVQNIRANPKFTMLPKSRATAGFVSESGDVVPAKDVLYARENAPKLEAGELAQKHGIAIDPSLTNPTRLNRLAVEQAGVGDTANALAMHNESRWNKIAASDPDINIQAPLSIDNIKAVRERAAEPIAAIGNTGVVPVGEWHLAEIDGLRMKHGISNSDSATAVNGVVDRATTMLKGGMDAADVLDNISQLRKDSRTIYKKLDAGPAEIAKADASLKIANTLEDMIDTHLSGLAERNPHGGFAELGDAYRQGRRSMAKSYAMEDAFDANTRQIDPIKMAKMTAKDNAATGHIADIGKIAGVFPEVSELGTRANPLVDTRLSKYGMPGLLGSGIGGVVGAMMGSPTAGMALGGLGGAFTGEALSRALRNRVVTPEVQARGISPVPRSMWDLSDVDPLASRAPRNPLEYERNPGASFDAARLSAPDEGVPPAGPRGPVSDAPAPYRHPNFQFGENNPPQPAPPGTGVVPGRPLTPEERFAQDKANFAAQDRTQYNREAALDALAQQKAEAEAAALRRPASRERVLDLNPMTGRLEPTSRGLPGATPETIRSTGNALESATNKLAEGRAFDMTLEEKAAWKHTRTSLVEGVPELRGMTERQIFDRIQDRQWVADTIKKLREKDIAFEGIKRTADENAARSAATKQRELLADQLEALQAQFDAMPLRQEPKTQGPKTRDAKRKFAGNDATIVINELRRR